MKNQQYLQAIGISKHSGLTPLSRIRDNGIINNGKSAAHEQPTDDYRPSVHEQLRKSPVHAGKPKKGVQSHAEMEL